MSTFTVSIKVEQNTIATTYFLGAQFPLPPPDGLPVVLGPFDGLQVPFPM